MQGNVENLRFLIDGGTVFFSVVTVWGVARVCETIKNRRLGLDKKAEHRTVVQLPEALREKESFTYKVSKVGINKEMSICLNEFITVMKQHPYTDMNRFYRNCTSYSIDSFKGKTKGTYTIKALFNLFDNKIFLSADPRGSVFHELMHRISLKLGAEYVFSGLSQKKYAGEPGKEYIVSSIGHALNEAYTQYLTERYFKDHGCNTNSYGMTKHIAYYIEHLVGKEKMEKAYFEADLYTVVQELVQYASLEEVIRMLDLMDDYADAIYERTSIPSKLVAKKTYRELMLIILKMELKKFESEAQKIEDQQERKEYVDGEVDFMTIMFVPRKDMHIRYQFKKDDARSTLAIINKYQK